MQTVLVKVHGAGKIPKNFYVEVLNALTEILAAKPALLPC